MAGNHRGMRPGYLDQALAHQGEPRFGKAPRLHEVILTAGPDRDKRRLGAHPGPWRGYQEPGSGLQSDADRGAWSLSRWQPRV